MVTHPDEFGSLVERLLESALGTTEGQFEEAEKIMTRQFPAVVGDAKAKLVVTVVQAIAINYLAVATLRNLPKG